jgi:uncharacterized protein DUF4399
MKLKYFLATIALFIFAAIVNANELVSKSSPDAKLYFIAPANGETVSEMVTVKFGLSGMGVAPAGMDKKNTGHHHLLIDIDNLPDLSKPLAATDKIKHFGGGQTETKLKLSPGTHTLQLLLGNHLHIPHDKPVMSEKITVIVK